MRKRICFVVSSISTAISFLHDHIEKLAEEFEVYLVGNFSADDLPILKEFKLSGYHSVTIDRKINLIKDIESVFALRRYFKEKNFFATHSVSPKAGLITACASYMARVPNRIHIFTGQVWHTKKGIFKMLLKNLDRLISKLDTHILVDGESQRQFLIKNKIIREGSSLVLGKGSISGVNVARFKSDPLLREQIRRELKISDKIVYGFLGRLNYDKGILDLFDAFNRLSEKNSSVYLLLIGYDEENMIGKLVNYPNVVRDQNFTYYGATLEPERILQAVDVFCLPSYREGFGTSVLEASCMGIPVICSDTYGLMDAMVDGITGLRHKVYDSFDLYRQMTKLAENEDLRKNLGTNAQAFVQENYTGELITREWINFYKSL